MNCSSDDNKQHTTKTNSSVSGKSSKSNNHNNNKKRRESQEIFKFEDDTNKFPEGASLTWVDVNVWAAKTGLKGAIWKQKQKRFTQILTDINGYARPGRMLALFAPSGSGKTTLLNFLSGNLSINLKSMGSVLVNQKQVNLRKISAYVQQTDLFFKAVTVKEHMMFHAQLRMEREVPYEEKEKKVEELLTSFGLIKQQHMMLKHEAYASQGLSGGERRRLSIVTELLTDPKVLFVDEPTSGLDSYLAESIVYFLKQYSLKGNTIVCTIHQPSTEVFLMFDDLCLLSQGKCIYMGTREYAIEYFGEMGYECPRNYNPADFYIETINMMASAMSKEGSAAIDTMSRNSKSQLIENVPEFVDLTAADGASKMQTLKDEIKFFFGQYKASLFTQFKLLFLRSIKSYVRSPIMLATRILQDVVLAIIMAALYWRLPFILQYIIDYGGIFFFESAGLTLNAVISAVVTFPAEVKVYTRETHSHIYRSSLYFLAKTLGELPIQIVQNVLFTVIVYFSIGLRPEASAFFLHLFFVFAIYQASLSYGYLISALAGDALVAAAMATPMLIPLMIFGGFLLRNSDIPVFLRWIKYISWFQYAFEGLLIINYEGNRIRCNLNSRNCFVPGSILLNALEVNPASFHTYVGGIIGLILGYRIFGCIIIVLRTNIIAKIHPV